MEETSVQPQLYVTAKDEQIQALTLSVQDLKQQLATAQQLITANKIGIQNVSTRVDKVEDGIKATQEDLTTTTLKGNKIKEDLTKQSQENLEALGELLTSSTQYLKETLETAEINLTAINKQNAVKMENVMHEVTTIKEKLVQDVITTQQNLNFYSQKIEQKISAVEEEIQRWHTKIRQIEDNLSQQLTSVEAKFAAAIEQLSISMQEGTIESGEKIKKIRQEYTMTKECLLKD